MTDNEIKRTVAKLKKMVDEVNVMMAELDKASVEVRISYVESKPSANVHQGLSIWRLTQHTDFLN